MSDDPFLTGREFASRIWCGLRSHWLFALVAIVGLILVLTNLGADYLWEDEGDTAVLASTILKCGLPKAWDGVTFTDSDRGARVNDDLIMVSHPWVQYYVTAASFLAFGENTFAARLPFALAGWLTILSTYSIVWRITGDRRAALCSMTLLVCSAQFLLYARQCRYYALSMFFTCWLVWFFLRMKSWRQCALFALTAILLFHTHPFGIVTLAVFAVLSFVHPALAPQRRYFWFALPGIAVSTLPWLAMTRGSYPETTKIVQSLAQFLGRFTQYLIECMSVTPLIGIIALLFICLLRRWWGKTKTKFADADKMEKGEPSKRQGNALLIVTFASIFLYAVAIALTQPTDSLWRIGIRYTAAVIPLLAMSLGIMLIKVSRGQMLVWLPLLLIADFTKFGELAPFTWTNKVATFDGNEVIEAHVPLQTINHLLVADYWNLVQDLWHSNPGSVAKTCEFLRQHAQPGDMLITNYESEPLYFHTRLPQALKILLDYPIYDAARRKGLPNYVFSVDRVRWVVWRPIWDGYQGYWGSELEREIADQGGRAERVAEIEETIWENRENVHFHRFAGGRYLYHLPGSVPATGIWRIDFQ